MGEEVREAYYAELWCELNEVIQEIKEERKKAKKVEIEFVKR